MANMVRLFRRSLPSDIEVATSTRGRPYPALVDPHQLENALINLALNARDAMASGGLLKLEITFVSLDEAAASTHWASNAGEYRPDRGRGHRNRHGHVDSRSGLRALLHHKAGGRGQRPRPQHGVRLRQAIPRRRSDRKRTRSRVRASSSCCRRAEEPEQEFVSFELATPRRLARDDDLVLLVEDDEQVRAVVRRQLMELGYRLIEAGQADEALELLENVPDFHATRIRRRHAGVDDGNRFGTTGKGAETVPVRHPDHGLCRPRSAA